MKKYLMLAATIAGLTFTSCDDMLDSENYTGANTQNFPQNEVDLNKEIAALYGVMNQLSTDPLQTPWLVGNIMSDDTNGAGGTGDVECKAIGHLVANKDGLFDNAWKSLYVGIARASAIIYTDPAIMSNIDTATRNQLVGEAYFMRGLFYMWATEFWGDIPAYWASAAPDPCPQVSAEEVIWPHILADFASAYNLMNYGATKKGDGHATKSAAAGFLARGYMFYEGFYKKAGELAVANPEAVTLPEQEAAPATLSKADVQKALEDAIQNGNNSLVPDFRQLWQYTNEYTVKDYAYCSDLAGVWAGNGNDEEIFQVQYANSASWNGTIAMGFTNQVELYSSLRCGSDAASKENGHAETFPFAQGWGQATINTNLWDEWPTSDPRREATILDCNAELEHFAIVTDCSEETCLYNKKIMAVTAKETAGNDMTAGPYTWWGIPREAAGAQNNNGNCMQGDHFSDIVLMRYADLLLMHTEISGDATHMNEVRRRVGLGEKPYTWQNIKDERRWEFAGEGLRFNDLRRWSGKNGGASCEAAVALQKQDGTKVWYEGNEANMHHATSSWAQRYADTDGFIMIPPGQIRVIDDEDVLKQNAGWTNDACRIASSPTYKKD